MHDADLDQPPSIDADLADPNWADDLDGLDPRTDAERYARTPGEPEASHHLPWSWPSWLAPLARELLGLAGGAVFLVGCWWMWPPAAMLVGGAGAFVAA